MKHLSKHPVSYDYNSTRKDFSEDEIRDIENILNILRDEGYDVNVQYGIISYIDIDLAEFYTDPEVFLPKIVRDSREKIGTDFEKVLKELGIIKRLENTDFISIKDDSYKIGQLEYHITISRITGFGH